MADLEFRPARPDDAEVLVELRCAFLVEAGTGPEPDERLRAAMRGYFAETIPAGEFAAELALHGGAIIATSGLVFRRVPPSIHFPTGREAYIMNMYTRPGWRGRGVATQLLARLLARARAAGCGKVTLHAFPKAAPIYTRAGFTPVEGEMRLDLRAQG